MVTIPAKVKERITAGLKKYQPILKKARDLDINESDTVTILVDVLSEMFGYDKYSEITSEYAIKHTYCDLAIKLDNTPRMLIEVKAAGLDLKQQHIKQSVDYGANSGIDWVILTNGVFWKIYKIIFSKPIDIELVYEFNLLDLSAKRAADIEYLYMLTREAMIKSSKSTSLDDFHSHKQIFNKYTISQILLSDTVIDVVKKSLKKMGATSKLENAEIQTVLMNDIIKRELLDADKAAEAKKKVVKALKPAPKKPTE